MTLEPKFVPADIVARWPAMALSLWKRSFRQQAAILLAAALLMKFFPAWSAVMAFLIAPSLFVVSFAAVQIADERSSFSWTDLSHLVLPGALRMGRITLHFGLAFALGIAALASLSAALLPAAGGPPPGLDNMMAMRSPAGAVEPPPHLLAEFLHFCATWVEGVMALAFLGMFIIAIYQGVFGAILHAQQGLDTRASRIFGWQAWQMNSVSIESALRDAPAAFWRRIALACAVIIGAFQTVYLSPVGLVLATYMPSLAYVAYRSIFFGMHQNVPASARRAAERGASLAPSCARSVLP